MNPGVLDTPIEIQHFVATRGDMGGQTKSWSTYHSCRARVINSKGSEKIEASKDTSISNTVFRVRFYAGIKTNMVVKLDGETYQIKSTANIGRKAYIDLFTEKRD